MVEIQEMNRPKGHLEGLVAIRKNSSFHHLRYILLVLSGIAMGLMMFMRLSVTVALIGMVNHTQIYVNEHPNATAEEVASNFQPGYIEMGEFDWTHEIQETIITCYMVTYTLFPIVTTRAIMRFGLRISIVVLLSTGAVVTLLTPTMAYWDWRWLVLLRLIMGAASSGVVPGMVCLIEQWTPSKESATGIVIYQFTGNIMAVLTPLFTGHIAQLDWKLAFYIPGFVTLAFCLIWWFFVADSPEHSRLLSQKELDHIIEPSKRSCKDNDRAKKSSDLEWTFMFKVREFWYLAFIWCLYCATSGSMIYLLPTYLHSVLKVSVKDVGMFTFIVQIGSLFSMLWPNTTVEILMNFFKCSLTKARCLVVFICIFLATSTILYLAAYHQYVVIMICLHRFFHMTHDTLFLATVLSNFSSSGTSGPIYSVLNSFGCINSTIFCIIVGKYLDYTGGSISCWSWVFIAFAIMNALYLLVYCGLCHSEPVEIKSQQPKGRISA